MKKNKQLDSFILTKITHFIQPLLIHPELLKVKKWVIDESNHEEHIKIFINNEDFIKMQDQNLFNDLTNIINNSLNLNINISFQSID